MTLEQMFESLRRASMSSLQMQQDLFKQWAEQWPSMPPSSGGVSPEWAQKLQKRWMEFTAESLNRHRESLDAAYKSMIVGIEQALRLSESRTPDDYRRASEDLRGKTLEAFKAQSEVQIREFQKNVEKWFDVLPKA